MNKKIVILIIVIFISFCFLSIGVADKAIQDNTSDHNKTIDNNNTTDKNKTSHKNKTDDKSKKNYIIAKGKGNDIKFSDGFRGFILDSSKSSARSGDEFKHTSTSKISDSNKLKLAVIEGYKLDLKDEIGKTIADIVKKGSSSSMIGKAVEASNKKVGDHEVVKINKHTEAVFDFEALKSVSGNQSDYFAYKVSFKTIKEDKKVITHHNLTNLTNTTNTTNKTNTTNTTNITLLAQPEDNETNLTLLNGIYDYLAGLANSLYGAWGPALNSWLNNILMFVNALEDMAAMFDNIMSELNSLMDALGKLLDMLESVWKGLSGLLKLLGVILTFIQQLLNLIGNILNFIVGLISSIISLIQQLLGWLSGLIDFILGLINQFLSFIQGILDFLKSSGSFLANVIKNAAIIITAFVIITIGAFLYNRIR